MPATSEAQRRAAGVALAAKRGKIAMSALKGPARQMVKMSVEDLRDFARKPRGAVGVLRRRRARRK